MLNNELFSQKILRKIDGKIKKYGYAVISCNQEPTKKQVQNLLKNMLKYNFNSSTYLKRFNAIIFYDRYNPKALEFFQDELDFYKDVVKSIKKDQKSVNKKH